MITGDWLLALGGIASLASGVLWVAAYALVGGALLLALLVGAVGRERIGRVPRVPNPPEEEIMASTSIVARRLPALLLGLTVACAKKASDTETAAAGDTMSAAAAAAAEVAVAPGGPVTLTVAARPGEAVFLTDDKGRAVYYIGSPDGKALVECTGECATAFDPVTGKAIVAAGDTAVKIALIGEITRPDGTTQVTYAGKPLYYHRGDQGGGGTTAQGLKTAGGEASLVGPDGNRASRPDR